MNTLAAVITLLKAQSNIAALVSTRVYGVDFPGNKDSFPLIVVTRVGGDSDPIIPVSHHRFDIRCLGKTQPEANSVYDALRVLHGQTGLSVGGYSFVSLRESTGPMDLQEPVTDSESWDCVFSTWEITIATA